MNLSVLELCAGGGGQALGLERAGFDHAAAVEIESSYCLTLRDNRPHWNVINGDIRELNGRDFTGLDLIAGGVPCPPFSIAGKQLGAGDERDMFPSAIELVARAKPRAVMFENVPGLATARFRDYRNQLMARLANIGYAPEWAILQAADFGVAQLRPRFVLVGFRDGSEEKFRWPSAQSTRVSVGRALKAQMGAGGWPGVGDWAKAADSVGPTIVGGSKKHGGPDLGPTRAKRQWASLGVNGMGIANEPPRADDPVAFIPKLTVPMVATLQGFPGSWQFSGKKTVSYRQVGNAFPPPVAEAVGKAVAAALQGQVVGPHCSLRLFEDSPHFASTTK